MIPVTLKSPLDFCEDVVCMQGCPVRTDCGMYVQQIASGDFAAAYTTARAPNPLASSCGLVCAAPCEDRCRRGLVDRPVSIRSLKKFITEQFGPEAKGSTLPAQIMRGDIHANSHTTERHAAHVLSRKGDSANGKRVAVLGSGPAGLGCAHDLALLGYKVTVFEALDRLGGQMRIGIPPYRLPDHVLDAELESIASLGVEYRINSPISSEEGIDQLFATGYAAVFLSPGLQIGRMIPLSGSELIGVYTALDYLNSLSLGDRRVTGKRVVVIGGGLVAMDAAREARRQLLAQDPTCNYEITVACLESLEQMPAHQSESGRQELEETLDEAIVLRPSYGPATIHGVDGNVTAIELKRVLSLFDSDGRFSPSFDEEDRLTIECDTVILAIGQAADLSFISKEGGVTISQRGLIEVDRETMRTSKERVYAGGDAAFGPGNLIDAVAHGKRAAATIHGDLCPDDDSANRPAKRNVAIEVCHTESWQRPEDYDIIERQTPPVADPVDRVGITMIEQSFDESEAIRQANRCLACHASPVYSGDLCILCGRCVDICPQQILAFAPLSELEVDRDAIAPALSANPEADVALLKDDSDCIRCGLCAIRCPTGALTMQRFTLTTV